MLRSYISTAYNKAFNFSRSAAASLKELLSCSTSFKQPAYQKIKQPIHSRHSERGNVFFTLFGAVAVVGVLGAGIMATMRGPLSTMVEVNLRERAKTEMAIASKLIMLESTDQTNSGDCDSDGFVEPIGYSTNIASLTGGGELPVGNKVDPWGNNYGYCGWDPGTTSGDTVNCTGDYTNLLDGDAPTGDADYSVIAIISAGPDGTFDSSCANHPTLVTPSGDDLIEVYTYEYAAESTGGLWNIKTGDPDVAEIGKNLEVTGGATFSDDVDLTGGSGALRLGAASLLLPDQNAVANCTDANDQIMRRNTASGDSIVQICDFTGTTTNWVNVGSIGSIWARGTDDDVYYNDGTPQVGIGTTAPDDTLDIVGTLDVSSTSTFGGLLTAENGLTVSAGTTTLGTTTISGVTTINNTLAVTNDVTITGSSNAGTGDSLTVNNSDSSKVFVVQHDGKVGIGDADPSEELDVVGDIVVTGTYMIDAYNVLASPNTTSDSNIFIGNNAGNMAITSTYEGNTIVGGGSAQSLDGTDNTILGQGSATSLTTGSNNIIIGQAVDVSDPAVDNELNIGDVITGNISTGDIAVAGDLTISGDDLIMGTNTDGAILVADGSTFSPVVASGDATIANDGAITIADGAVDEPKLDISNGPSGGDCLKYISGNLEWQACSGGGGGDGVGTDGFTDLADTPSAYAGAAADANKLVVVNPTGDGLIFVDTTTAVGDTDRIEDSTDPTDTYIDVDTTDDGLTNSTLFVNNGSTSMTIASTGAVTMTGSLAVADDVAFDTNTFYLDASANNVGFGTTTPAASALIDMTSTTLGLLPPRMTEAQRDAINSGTFATGLVVFNTDAGDNGLLQFYDGSDWIDVGGGGAEGGGLWTDLGGDRIHYGTTGTEQVGIGTNNPLTTLDVNGGVRVGSVAGAAPNYMVLNSLADVDTSPSNGDCLIYNSTSTNWEEGSCASAIDDDILDWDKFIDSMTLDATTNIAMDDAYDFSFDTDTLFIDSDAKSIGIGTATPNANAALDVNGTNLGFLPPRNANPASNITGTAGLIAYDSGDDELQYYNGSEWVSLVDSAVTPNSLDWDDFIDSMTLDATTNIAMDDAYDFSFDTDTLFIDSDAKSIGIGTATPNANAALDVNGTNLGFLPPRNANPASNITGTAGLIAYDSGDDELQYYNGSEWVSLTAAATPSLALNDLTDVFHDTTTDFDADTTNDDDNLFIGHLGASLTGTADPNKGARNTAIGATALDAVTEGDGNVAIGYNAGSTVTTGFGNVFIGTSAGSATSTGSSIVSIGNSSGRNIGNFSTVMGYNAGSFASGSSATYIGYKSGEKAGAAANSTAVGKDTLWYVTGDNNVALGAGAALGVDGSSTAANSVFIGRSAGTAITTGNNNIFMGYQAGDVVTEGGNNIIIGYDIDPSGATASNELNIGGTIFGDLSTARVGIGVADASAIDANAALEVSGTDLGFLPPRNANPASNITGTAGLIAYDSGDDELQYYNGSEWVSLTAAATPSLALNDLTDVFHDTTTDFNGNTTNDDDNLFIGHEAASLLATADPDKGFRNIVIGATAGDALTEGNENTIMGYAAGSSLTTGNSNTLIGKDAGSVITTNGAIVAIGRNSGLGIGSNSVAIGYNAAQFGTGTNNTFVGYKAGSSTGTATGNSALGANALEYIRGGNNVGLGRLAGQGVDSVSTAANSIFIGESAGTSITTGNDNTLVGYLAGTALTTGGDNIAIGSGSLVAAQAVTSNIAIGKNAAAANNNANGLIAIGADAAKSFNPTVSNSIIAIGNGTADAITTKTLAGSIFIGDNAQGITSTGSGNAVVIGASALSKSVSNGQTVIGKNAMQWHTGGESNVAIGFQAARGEAVNLDYGGANNVIIGKEAAIDLDLVNDRNTIIGADTAATLTGGGSGNILLGYGVDVSSTTSSNELNIGGTIFGDLSTARVGIGVADASAIDANAALDVNGTNLGFLPPRNANPASNITGTAGLIAYDSTDNQLQYYNGSAWVTLSTASGVIAIDDLTDGVKNTTQNNFFLGHEGGGGIGVNNLQNTAVGIGALDALDSAISTSTMGDNNTALGYNALTTNTSGGYNTAIGNEAMRLNATGGSNTAVGHGALERVITFRNTAVGANALNSSSGASAESNTAIGANTAMYLKNASAYNVFMGTYAGEGPADYDYTGSNNVIIGHAAARLMDNTNNQNTIIGSDTAATLTGGGSGNILLGYGVDVPTTTTSNYLNIGDLIYGDLQNKTTFIGFLAGTETNSADTALYVKSSGDDSSTFSLIATNNDDDIAFSINDSGQVGIGTAAVSVSAALQIDSSTRGFLPPRNANPASNITGTAGLIAYDSGDDELQYYNGSEWVSLTAAATPSLALNDLTDVFHDTTTDFNGNTTNDDDNLFIGHLAASLTGTADPNKGSRNTAIGATALDAVTEGDSNVAIGYDAGSALTTGFGNVFIGPSSGRLMTTNSSIVAIGSAAGRNIGSFSTVMGYQAGFLASGGGSTYIGYKSGEAAGAASGSTALGKDTLQFVTGNNNVAVGGAAAIGVDGSSTAANSVFIGQSAGTAITTGNNNIFMGYQAGNVVTEGSNNIVIGYDEDISAVDADNELNIGGTIFGDLSTARVGIGVADASAIDANAALEVSGTDLGFLPPRNANPASNITGTAGLIAYDSGDDELQYYNGSEWVSLTAAAAPDRIQDVGNNTHIDVDTTNDGATDSIVFTTNNATAMTIDSSGDIQATGSVSIAEDLSITGTTRIGPSGAALAGSSDTPLTIQATTGFTGTLGISLNSSVIRTSTLGNVGYSALQNTANIISNGQNVTQDVIAFENDPTFQTANASLSKIYGIKNGMDTVEIGSGSIVNAYGYYGSNPTISAGTGPTNVYGIYLEDMTTGVTNNYAIYSAGGISYFADPIVIGAATPNANAALDVNGTNLGFLPPRNANPASNITGTAGLIAYDSGDDELQYYNGSEWVSLTAAATPSLALNDLTDVFHDTTTDFNNDASNNDDNLFIGHLAASLTGTADPNKGSRNTAIGATALDAVTQGDNNVAIGYDAGSALTTGTGNILLGSGAGGGLLNTNNNVIIGLGAASAATAGSSVYIGYFSGNSSSGQYNAGVGFRSLQTPDGSGNTALGFQAGKGAGSTFTAAHNVFIGYNTGEIIDTGSNNILVGYQAGNAITTGGSNIIIGYDIDPSGATASNELNIGGTIFGDLSTARVGIGVADATAIDANAALDVNGTNLGFLPPRNAAPASNITGTAGLIAYDSTDNELQYYNGSGWVSLTAGAASFTALSDTPADYTGGVGGYLVSVNGGATALEFVDPATIGGSPAGSNTQIQFNNSGSFGASSNFTWNGTTLAVTGDITFSGVTRDVSDARLKTDINPLNADDIITRLAKIDTYSFRMKADPSGRKEFGVMAQELETIFPELVHTADDEMGTKSVNYIGLIAPMIEATKTLKAENDALKSEIASIKTAQDNMLEKVNALSVHTGYSVEKAGYDKWIMLAMIMMLAGGMAGLLIRRKQA